MKTVLSRLAPIIAVVLFAVILLAACDTPEPRVLTVPTYSPGASFSTNFNNPEQPQRQIKCTVVFEVIDEQAIDELTENNFKIRNSVLSVLGELTMDEITVDRDLDAIGARIVDRVNEDLQARGDMHLVVRAYFTEFQIA